MNLFDLVKRKDRSVEVERGRVDTETCSLDGYKMHAVNLEPKTILRLNKAHEFETLRTFPRRLNWTVLLQETSESGLLEDTKKTALTIELEMAGQPETRGKVFSTSLNSKDPRREVLIDWPTWANRSDGYHIYIINPSSNQLCICSGYAFNPRQKIIPLLKGKGVEVGPGLNPQVKPGPGVNVKYVESTLAEEWVKLYKKEEKPQKKITDDLWSQYVVDDAQSLLTIPESSVDFVFSNHVFEHLMNPKRVLENWLSKLKPGGLIAGVVPDCRFTFDLRQSPSNHREWEAEYNEDINEITREKYERWCRFTAPYNTPESLIERNYSIHVHYYTPDSFDGLVQSLAEECRFKSVFYNTSPNNKDFGFVLGIAGSRE
jgi:SAM-dependent methyltransferase